MVSVEFWRMGATPVPSVQIERFAREFEAAGWDGFAVGEAHGLLPDPYIVLGRGAAATTTLRLGTAVAVPLRSPLLAASAMATLHGLTGGRTSFSIGRGDGAVKVLKRKPMRVADFEAYLTRLQSYLRGEEVEADGVTTSMARVYDIDPSLRLPKPMIDVAATGPRTIEVAAKTADGVSFSVGADVERLRRSVELVRDTCNRIGRDFESLRLGSYLQVAVTDDDQSAREAIRGLVVTHARFSGLGAQARGRRQQRSAHDVPSRPGNDGVGLSLVPGRRHGPGWRASWGDRFLPPRGRRRRAHRPVRDRWITRVLCGAAPRDHRPRNHALDDRHAGGWRRSRRVQRDADRSRGLTAPPPLVVLVTADGQLRCLITHVTPKGRTPADAGRTAPSGSNPGSKLSATEPNSEQLRPPQSAESQRVRPDRSGWGPGGRRFKSCLPDRRKVLLMGLFSRAVATSGRGTNGENLRRDSASSRRSAWL